MSFFSLNVWHSSLNSEMIMQWEVQSEKVKKQETLASATREKEQKQKTYKELSSRQSGYSNCKPWCSAVVKY